MSILTMLVLSVCIVLGLVFLLMYYLALPTMRLPNNWKQIIIEIRWILLSNKGILEDFYLRKRNQVELFPQPGRVAVITGGNRGIGAKVVEKLLNCKIDVIMGVRNPEQAQKTIERHIDCSKFDGVKIHYFRLDNGSFKTVQKFAQIVQHKFPKIDILINCAGIMTIPYQLTEDGFEDKFAINYLGHFLLTHLLMPQLRAAGTKDHNARIINISSCAHVIGEILMDDINGTKDYHPLSAYSRSKLAQIYFTRHLQFLINQNENCHIQVHAVHPGFVDTHIFDCGLCLFPNIKKLLLRTTEEGSRCIVYAAIARKIEGKGGSYLCHCSQFSVSPMARDKEFGKDFFDFSCKLLAIEEFGTFK